MRAFEKAAVTAREKVVLSGCRFSSRDTEDFVNIDCWNANPHSEDFK